MSRSLTNKTLLMLSSLQKRKVPIRSDKHRLIRQEQTDQWQAQTDQKSTNRSDKYRQIRQVQTNQTSTHRRKSEVNLTNRIWQAYRRSRWDS